MGDLLGQSPFDEFWEVYPRKVGKGQARKSFAKALKIARFDDIMFGLSQQLNSMQSKERQFIPHPSTWLTGERWQDEIEPVNTSGTTNGRGMAGGGKASEYANFGIEWAAGRTSGR